MIQIGNLRMSKLGITIILLVFLLVTLLLYQSLKAPFLAIDGSPETICLKQLLVAAIQVAERGGQAVKKVKQEKHMQIKSKGKTLEGVNDPVTLGDMLSHNAMYFSLLKMWPKLHIVSEEHNSKIPDTKDIESLDLNTEDIEMKLSSQLNPDVRLQDVTVWIDPLDATKEYTENLNKFVTTMVCVAVKGEPVIGVIHQPFLSQTVWAWAGHGRSAVPDTVTNMEEVKKRSPHIIVSMSHKGMVETLAREVFDDYVIVSAGGAGYKVLQVANNKVDAYLHTTLIKKWDICAGHALLKQMGGKMTDLLGNEIDYSLPSEPGSDVKLKTGLLATLRDHDFLLKKLRKRSSLTSS